MRRLFRRWQRTGQPPPVAADTVDDELVVWRRPRPATPEELAETSEITMKGRPSMTDHNPADPNPISPGPGDSSSRIMYDPPPAERRRQAADCTACGGTGDCPTCHAESECPRCKGSGIEPTVNDLLRESLGLLHDNTDPVIRTFYEHLLRAAPDLARMFPADLIDPLSPAPSEGGRSGRGQRDLLVAALLDVANDYDPDDGEALRRLEKKARNWGRWHSNFVWADGHVGPAGLEHYNAVKAVLFATLLDAAGSAWRDEFTGVWSQAFDRVTAWMIDEGYEHPLDAPRMRRR
jgi:prepilin-type processing-associated H-X9-DG protein